MRDRVEELRIASEIGARVREQRESRGWTQRELATASDQREASISNWESGRKLPTVATLQSLAEALGVSLGYLVDGSDDAHGDEAVHPALARYLASEDGRALEPHEVAVLSSLRWPGISPAPATYAAIVAVIRGTARPEQ